MLITMKDTLTSLVSNKSTGITLMKNTSIRSIPYAVAFLTILILGTSYAHTGNTVAASQPSTFDLIPFDHNSADVPDMTTDERDGTITRTWRRTGENQGYYLYFVTIGDSPYGNDFNPAGLVQIADQDTMATDPQHVGENSLSAILFARRQTHDNNHTTLFLLRATRHPQKDTSAASPLPTTVELYALTARPREITIGETPYYFQLDASADIGHFTRAEAALDAVVKKHLDHQTLMLLGIP